MRVPTHILSRPPKLWAILLVYVLFFGWVGHWWTGLPAAIALIALCVVDCKKQWIQFKENS
jgi:hypothetical protein